MIRRLASLLSIVALGLTGAVLLLLASHQGEVNRCSRLHSGSLAYQTYCR